MDLVKALMGAAGSGQLEKLGSQFGLDNSAVEKVLGQVVPAMGRGINKNAGSGGMGNLINALQNGNHQRYLGNAEAATSQEGIAEGNSILGHILGSKDVSRNLAAHASSNSGVSPDLIKKMLPVVATMVMGTISKQTDNGAQLESQGSKSMGGLASMLDSNNDGSVMDDVLDMAKRFF